MAMSPPKLHAKDKRPICRPPKVAPYEAPSKNPPMNSSSNPTAGRPTPPNPPNMVGLTIQTTGPMEGTPSTTGATVHRKLRRLGSDITLDSQIREAAANELRSDCDTLFNPEEFISLKMMVAELQSELQVMESRAKSAETNANMWEEKCKATENEFQNFRMNAVQLNNKYNQSFHEHTSKLKFVQENCEHLEKENASLKKQISKACPTREVQRCEEKLLKLKSDNRRLKEVVKVLMRNEETLVSLALKSDSKRTNTNRQKSSKSFPLALPVAFEDDTHCQEEESDDEKETDDSFIEKNVISMVKNSLQSEQVNGGTSIMDTRNQISQISSGASVAAKSVTSARSHASSVSSKSDDIEPLHKTIMNRLSKSSASLSSSITSLTASSLSASFAFTDVSDLDDLH